MREASRSVPPSAKSASTERPFSGQNDTPDATEEFEGGRVESFGDIVQEAIDVYGDGKDVSALVPIITGEGPGVECRGTHR